jgi:hypothetical protein
VGRQTQQHVGDAALDLLVRYFGAPHLRLLELTPEHAHHADR